MRFDFPTPDRIGELRTLWKQAFQDTDGFLDDFFSTGFSPDRCRCATVNGRLAATLYWFDCQCEGRKIAYLYAVATDMAFRRQGICHALMADTHRLLAEQGYSGVMLVPGESSLASLYNSMGYRYCTTIREFFCTADPEPASLRLIDAEEYARLRRQLLPADAVLQEDQTLPFLRTQAKFYAAAHLLLAARKEEQTLFGLELLGDAAAAPGILSALGAAQGRFRTPGEGRPFAMYYSFDGSPAPGYFAFAFD